MQTFYLVDDDFGIIAETQALSYVDALVDFRNRGYTTGETMTSEEFIIATSESD